MNDDKVTTLIETIRRALAAMALPDVVVGFEHGDDDGLTFLVGDKELHLGTEIVDGVDAATDDDAQAREQITARLRELLLQG